MRNPDGTFTYAEGSVVRLDRVPHKVLIIHLDGTVTLSGPRGARTVDSSRLTPAHKGDVVEALSAPGWNRKAAR